MASKSYSFSVNVETKEAESESSRASVETKVKDPSGREAKHEEKVEKLNSASVSQAIGAALRQFAGMGLAFVDVKDGDEHKPEPDGFQGDVPESEKPKDDDGKKLKPEPKQDDKEAGKPDQPGNLPGNKPSADPKPAAGDKPAPAKK